MHGRLPKAAWRQPQHFCLAGLHQLGLDIRLLPLLEGEASSEH